MSYFKRKLEIGFLLLALTICTQMHSSTKKALIFGITGQDGAYLTELLLEKGYEVHGAARSCSTSNTSRLDQFTSPHLFLHTADLTDANSVLTLVREIKPDEIYNLAAQSHVGLSFEMPKYTVEVDAMGTLYILEAIRLSGLQKKTKFYQASTSELFGQVEEIPQREKTPFHPRSPYGVAKLFAYWITVNYREAYGIFTCNGILFNHESPLRGENFVTRKITLAACRCKLGQQECLYLGNLDAKRDWGYAKDYVEAMWLMMQQEKPDDYVIATQETHSVREFVELSFKKLGIDIEWVGSGVDEYGKDKLTGKVLVRIDPKYYRPAEVDFLIGNTEKARKVLQWKNKTKFQDLVTIMVNADMEKLTSELSK